MILRIFAISVTALVAGSFIEHARAGQFFVCEDGNTIEIETPRLEHAKKTIPCVAKHYGLEIQANPKRAVEAKPTVEVEAKSMVGVSKAESNGTDRAQHSHARPTAAAASTDVVIPMRKPALPKLRETDTKPVPSGRQGMRLVAEAANSDSRRVRIINAGPGAAKWFHVKH
ncbi:MAG: hypothetical protein ACR2OV_03225 [Hyphomicrobiaceae bacterium]